MLRNTTVQRKKIAIFMVGICLGMAILIGRIFYLMVFQSEYYGGRAKMVQERERTIKAARGKIYDCNGVELAGNKTVCTISVIHSQIKDPEKVCLSLAKELKMDEKLIEKRVQKVSSIEKIKSNVPKEIGDKIRELHLDGVKVDEDYKRYYPYGSLASKAIGFTGGDNQGIVGLEVKYDHELQGKSGKILTVTDAKGIEIKNGGETRIEPKEGNNLVISLDYNIQTYAQEQAKRLMEEKQADGVSILIMNPQNGEIMTMVDLPEYDLNNPFQLEGDEKNLTGKKLQDAWNKKWRNFLVNDTYEPGSTFKIITSCAALEEGVVKLDDRFFCPGYKIVEDRRIRCAKVTGHGSQDFREGIMNSCNPVFMEVGMRLGAEKFYDYFKQFRLLERTGIDLPGEAGTIMHKKENIGQVELATISFGQSFQITPMQLATTVSSLINGGNRVTPHMAVKVVDEMEKDVKTFSFSSKGRILKEETSKTIRELLENVVAKGTGKNAAIEGYRIGGKTATSQTLPRSSHKYISSFLGFAPANNPKVLVLILVNNPKGIYYGGTIAAPVAGRIFSNILPYLGIEKSQ